MGGQKTRKAKGKSKKHSQSNRILMVTVCILAVVCLFAGGVYIDTFYGDGRIMKWITQMKKIELPQEGEKQSVESMAVDVGSKAAVAVFEKEFLLCTKDGVKYFEGMGHQKWNDTFNMTSPVLIQEGEYLAVGDMSGNLVRVYHQDGMLYELRAEGTLIQFALNEKGYLSLITKENKNYRVRIYNAKGTLLKERIEESRGVYPLSSDISDDSKIFAVSYLDTTDITPIGRVLSFYIDVEESAEHTDSMFAAVEKEGEIIPMVKYRKGGILAAVSDKNIYGIGMDGQEVWAYPLENTVEQVAFGAKDSIVLALGDSVADKDGRKKGTICWLDTSGKETASFESGETVTYLSSNEKGVILGNDRKYTGLSNGGNENWNYTATSDMGSLASMEKLNTVITVGKDKIEILNMSKEEVPTMTTEPEKEETSAETKDAEIKDVETNDAKTKEQEPVEDAIGETSGTEEKPAEEQPEEARKTGIMNAE